MEQSAVELSSSFFLFTCFEVIVLGFRLTLLFLGKFSLCVRIIVDPKIINTTGKFRFTFHFI